jgi:eukaryotic-like serine/threonine-protein kinase
MAVVFLAQTARPGAQRFVALKCIRPELARDPRFVEMFLDEAKLAARIQHPNVCNVLDFGQHHGTYYLTMELLAGRTLTAIQHELTTAPDLGPAARAGLFARILEHACEGIHAAHETRNELGELLHVVHRDASPDNLFVTYDGNVKVMDFGVAYTSDKLNATRTGIVKGKCRYLAPEIITGGTPTRSADIWSLGVVAWEMFTQRRLFDQPSDPAVLHAIVDHIIPLPSTVREGLPAALDAIVMRALERDPEKRYPTAREFGRALNRFIVEQQLVIGAAEIADFLNVTFPEGVACARQLVRVADQLEAPPPPRTRTRTKAPENPTMVADAPLVRELARKSAAAPATESSSTTRLWHSRLRWLLVTATLLVIASGTVFACLHNSVTAPPATPNQLPTSFTLEASPATVDESGALLLRIRVVPTVR